MEREAADLRRRLSQVDVSNARDAVVMFDHDPAWLHLGDDHFAERLTTYLELAPALAHQFPAVDYVDLRFDERVFVRPAARSVKASRDEHGTTTPDRVDAGIASRRIVE